ncbi:transposase [Bengtsoniella intestinalis]|uniref:transposase n=1 Tax=Bengtsoniella intestinalis TaxID=3073143 RepID=UPI00391EEA97
MELPKRKSVRFPEYDYSQSGAYFVTICAKDHACLLGVVVGATCGRPSPVYCQLSGYGQIIERELQKISQLYYGVIHIDHYVIMPNHIHLLLRIENGECGRPQVAPTVSRMIQQFKGSITKQIGQSIWQKSFHDRIIRKEQEYLAKWKYIDGNIFRWQEDEYYKA